MSEGRRGSFFGEAGAEVEAVGEGAAGELLLLPALELERRVRAGGMILGSLQVVQASRYVTEKAPGAVGR